MNVVTSSTRGPWSGQTALFFLSAMITVLVIAWNCQPARPRDGEPATSAERRPSRPMFSSWKQHDMMAGWAVNPEYVDNNGFHLAVDPDLNIIAILAIPNLGTQYGPAKVSVELAVLWEGPHATHIARTENLLRWVDAGQRQDIPVDAGVAASVLAAIRSTSEQPSDFPDILLTEYRGPDRARLEQLAREVDRK